MDVIKSLIPPVVTVQPDTVEDYEAALIEALVVLVGCVIPRYFRSDLERWIAERVDPMRAARKLLWRYGFRLAARVDWDAINEIE